MADSNSIDNKGSASVWSCASRVLRLDNPVFMGILNVTPDSFSDGGCHNRIPDAVAWAEKLADSGASIIDIGGESTRPGSTPVSEIEEMQRVIPVIEQLRSRGFAVPVSVDTRRASVAAAALNAGAEIVNDITGLSDPEMIPVVRDKGAGVVIMHGGIRPADESESGSHVFAVSPAEYHGAGRVAEQIAIMASAAESCGIQHDRICVDPGFGFGKKGETNFELLDGLDKIAALGYPVLVGASRKHFLTNSHITHGQLMQVAYKKGARIFRVHDVAAATRVGFG